jgi:hypothetical protein
MLYIINRFKASIVDVITFGYGRFLICAMPVIFATVILSCMINFDRSIDFMAAATKNSQVNTFVTLTDQMALQERNISSNQSGDITAIKNSISEEVQLLRNMTQGFERSSTQSSFAALGVFLLGLTLLLYGLKLTMKATSKVTSMYFKAMMLALLTPVIIIIVIYQLGIVAGITFEFTKATEPFFFISLVLWIPIGIVIFLLVVEKRLLSEYPKKQP